MCFCDANGLAHGWQDEELASAYRKADAVMSDGIVMVKLAEISGGNLPGRVIGPVFFEKAMAYGVGRGWRHGFCGTNEDTLAKLKANMERRFPGVNIVGSFAPEYSADPAVPQGIDCDFLWVALGSPKQEKCALSILTNSRPCASCRSARRLISMPGRRRPFRIGCIKRAFVGFGVCSPADGAS